ncbi:MAG: hypothetical protein A2506_08745 [Elusimicrobia bacterium RIFOXYD12_FULL_66_9]|nr:MAG: hypothetical protein A2506_08745 [Elusimicrobia bacterium RIFOXYD12_FULL_66_9]
MKKLSTTPTWILKVPPAVWSVAAPLLPVGEPWEKDSPGSNVSRRLGVPGWTGMVREVSGCDE